MLVAILLLLLVVAYFVGTSEGFLKSVILPRVSKAMNATVTIEGASISPFSEVILRNLKVVTTGTEPLLTAQEVHARYSLTKMMGGNIVVQEVTVASPTINVVENADGTSNLDPLTKGQKEEKKEQPSKPSKPSGKPPQVDLQKFVLSNATIRQTKNYKGGNRDVTEISNFNIMLQDVKNGGSGKLQIGANVAMNNNPPAPKTNGVLQAKLNVNVDFTLKPDLSPSSVKAATDFLVDKAAGGFADAAGFGANLNAELTPTDLKEVVLRFQKGGTALGEVRASGPLDTSKQEGKIRVDVLSIDRQVLNLAGASAGLDFGTTTISSTNVIELSNGGKLITTVGGLNIGKFAVTQKGQTTPTLDLQTVYNVKVDQAAEAADIQTLNITGTQNQKELLVGLLTSPMKISWGKNAAPAGDSEFRLAVTGLNLADWKPFVGDAAPAGVVGLKLKLQSQQSGKLLTFDTLSDIAGLTVNAGSNRLENLGVTLSAQGTATDMNKFDLRSYKLDLAQQNQPMLSVSGSGQYDQKAESADMQVALEENLPPTFRALGQANAVASAGKLTMGVHVVKTKDAQTVTGNMNLVDFTGHYGDYQFNRFASAMDLDVQMNGSQLAIRKANGKLTSGGAPGGAFDVSGNYDITNKSGQFDIKLADLNQNALRPFLESMLHDKKLVSVSISSSSSARLDGDDMSIKTTLQVTNLVVSDPANPGLATPLEAKLALDSSMAKKVLDLRQCQLTLTPTQRAKNEMNVTGKVDMSNSNALTGNIKLAADSLDFTRYYDIFSANPAQTNASSRPPATTSPGATAPKPESKPQEEPAPIKLPVQNFVVDANIGKLYLREMEVTNFQTLVKLDPGTVAIQPFQAVINGGPLNAKVNLDLSVPGYKYDVTFGADKIPIEPLANTFSPEKKGMYKGNLLASLNVTGAGVTGTSLKKYLGGQFSLALTNAAVQISNEQLKGFLIPIATFLGASDLLDSPMNQLVTTGQMGNGKIGITQVSIFTGAFAAETKGDVLIADDVMKSTFNNWPMHLSVSRAIAQKVRIAPKNTPADQPYVALPDFIQVTGTLDQPKPKLDLNMQSIAGTVLDKYGNKIPGVDQKTGNALKGLGGLLGGGATSTNQAAGSTNQPATNAPASSSPLDLLNSFRKKK